MIDLIDLYKKLNSPKDLSAKNSDYYIATTIPGFPKHKLAKDNHGNPCLLIFTRQSIEPYHPIPIKLEHLTVLFDVDCKITQGNKLEESRFTVLCCAGDDQSLKEYFLRICSTLLLIIGKAPPKSEVAHLIDQLIELFRALNKTPRKSAQGLWAELLLISLSSNPALLINSWHQSPNDTYDFSANDQRIEVKSINTKRRLHHFSLEQINPKSNICVLIASIIVERIGTGISILELADMVRSKVSNNPELLFFIDRVIGLTLGSDWQSVTKEKFDYKLGEKSLNFYSSAEIPSINIELPKEISDVHFKVDLTDIPEIDTKTLIDEESIFKAVMPK